MTNHYLNKVPVLTKMQISTFFLKCGNSAEMLTDESAGVYLCDLDNKVMLHAGGLCCQSTHCDITSWGVAKVGACFESFHP